MLAAALASTQPVDAQSDDTSAAPLPALEQAVSTRTPSPATPDDPYPRRPQCASMFLKADWQLSSKQRTCDWIHNRMFSTSALAGAAWSAGFSMVRDSASEQGDGFSTRFSRKFAQNAFKSTGSYVGGLVFHEDPRTRPPYLVMKPGVHPHGFFRRTAHALGTNLTSYRCDGARGLRPGHADCTKPEHIAKVPAISRVVGSLASGASSELWESQGRISGNRALRGAASAYASTFVNALFVEFKPELNAIAGKTFRALFGGR